jgi:hypothetical protein
MKKSTSNQEVALLQIEGLLKQSVEILKQIPLSREEAVFASKAADHFFDYATNYWSDAEAEITNDELRKARGNPAYKPDSSRTLRAVALSTAFASAFARIDGFARAMDASA